MAQHGALAQAQQAVQAAQAQAQPMPQPGGQPAGAPGVAPPQAGGPPPGAPQPQPGAAQPPPGAGEVDIDIPSQDAGSGQIGGADVDSMLEDATPSEQKEYERAMGALYKIMYEDDSASNSLIGQLSPEEKVGSVAKASMLLITQLDDKLDFDEAIIAQMTEEVVDRVIELGEAKFGEEMSFTDNESQAALGATWEGVMQIFGVDEQDSEQLTAGMDKNQKSALEKQYEGALNG